MRILVACAFALLLGCPQSRAGEANYITFSCDGKVTGSSATNPEGDAITKIGVVVNLADRTVSFNSNVVPITKIDAAVITFEGRSQTPIMGTMLSTYVSGNIDRVTGAMAATTIVGTNLTTNWELYCKPTTRMF